LYNTAPATRVGKDIEGVNDVHHGRRLMQSDGYKGYVLWGHAIQEHSADGEHVRYVASGTVTKDGKFAEASGILDVTDSEIEAEFRGLEWARAWVDNHS
jgi:hypothetical protein